ncbi:MAG: hypothetical protein O7A03_02515, partial [Alphaproteobacteria bacterium]|nr:hypothetical protein [Alphaproteobacteria bacterium]
YQFDLEIQPGNRTPVVPTYNRSGGDAPEPQLQFMGTAAQGIPGPADLSLADNPTTALEGRVADLTERLELAEAQIMEIRGLATAAMARLAAFESGGPANAPAAHGGAQAGDATRPAIRAVPVNA